MRSLSMWVMSAVVAVTAFGIRAEDAKDDGWVTILDEKSFKEWKVAPGDAKSKVEESDTEKKVIAGDPKKDGKWEFKDGVLHAEGGVSHIFSPRNDYENFAYK